MIKWPTLSRNAVVALARATLPGPNCRHKQGFEQFLSFQDDSISLKQLVSYFNDGPDHFLVAYSICHEIPELEDYDIVGAYCLEHIPMVMAAERIFYDYGFKNEYFEDMRERGFTLNDNNLAVYLLSCIGKIGQVMSIDYSQPFNKIRLQVRVGSRFVTLKNVVLFPNTLIKIGDLVAVHFASAFAKVPKETATEICKCQLGIPVKRPFLSQLCSELPDEIDYSEFLGQNLTKYTEGKLSSK